MAEITTIEARLEKLRLRPTSKIDINKSDIEELCESKQSECSQTSH